MVPGYEIDGGLRQDERRTVYAAHDESGTEVAVTVIPREVADGLDALSAHPFAVPVLAHGALGDGRGYVVTERCAPVEPPLSPRTVAELGQRFADVVVAAHDLDLTHGGITPADVVVRPDGTTALGGFGLAPGDPAADVTGLCDTLRLLATGGEPDVEVPAELAAVLDRGYADAAALRVEFSQLTVARLGTAVRRSATTGDDGRDGGGGGGGATEPAEPESVAHGRIPPVRFAVILVVGVLVVLVIWLLV